MAAYLIAEHIVTDAGEGRADDRQSRWTVPHQRRQPQNAGAGPLEAERASSHHRISRYECPQRVIQFSGVPAAYRSSKAGN